MAMPTTLEKARATVVLDYPFFASVLLRHPLVATPSIKTCSINGVTGAIRYNPEFVETLTVRQTVRLLCHELMHYLSMDSLRVGHRDHKKWNHVADEWINDMLSKSGVGEDIPGAARRPGASDSTREQLYDMLPPDDPEKEKDDNPPNGEPPPPDSEPGDQPGNGAGDDPTGNDMEEAGQQLTEADASELEAKVKMELAQAAQAAKSRGKLSAMLQQFVTDTINSKVPWFEVLERLCTEHVKSDTNWARPNRRYAPQFYLPITDSVGQMGEMAVQVDISGSVSAEEIKYYNGHLKRIVELCKPTKVHLIYTDTKVQHHEEFDNPEDMEIVFHSGGGTDMLAGFRYLEEKGIEPAVMVTLTDGYTDFPAPGQFSVPTIWCISNEHIQSPTGETVAFNMNDSK